MPPRKKLCVPTQGKWNPVSIFFVPQPPKTNDEQVAARAEAEERKLRANEAKDRIKSVLKSLRIDAAAAESRSAGRPAARMGPCLPTSRANPKAETTLMPSCWTILDDSGVTSP